jgi:beta-lactamase class A
MNGSEQVFVRASLVASVDRLIRESGADTVSIAYRNLESQEEYFLNADKKMNPASTIKIAVLAEVFRQVTAGKFRLEDRLPITNLFYSSLDGSSYALSEDDDGDKTLYPHIGETETIYELARRMIVRSGNLATNLLMDRVSSDAVNITMTKVGSGDLFLRNRMMDTKAFDAGKTNLGTARALCHLLSLLAERQLVSPEASEGMLTILKGQEFRDSLPAELPSDVRMAHKTGNIGDVCHDAGIIYPADGRPSYVLVVMTRGITETEKAEKLIAAISKRFYTTL